jgi:hypothetical protein
MMMNLPQHTREINHLEDCLLVPCLGLFHDCLQIHIESGIDFHRIRNSKFNTATGAKHLALAIRERRGGGSAIVGGTLTNPSVVPFCVSKKMVTLDLPSSGYDSSCFCEVSSCSCTCVMRGVVEERRMSSATPQLTRTTG